MYMYVWIGVLLKEGLSELFNMYVPILANAWVNSYIFTVLVSTDSFAVPPCLSGLSCQWPVSNSVVQWNPALRTPLKSRHLDYV